MAQNFSMISGDTKLLELTIHDAEVAEVDVTGADVTYVIADSAVRVTKTTDDGITIDGAVVTVTLDPADTAELAGVYAHEMQITDPSGNVGTVMIGEVSIAKDIIT